MLQLSKEKEFTSGKAIFYKLKRQKKFKDKKNMAKGFHGDIHQSTKSWSEKHKERVPFDKSLEMLLAIAIGTVFSKIQCSSRSCFTEMFLKKLAIKNFAKESASSEPLFWQNSRFKRATLLKRDSNTGVFPLILWNFENNFFAEQ